MTGQAVRVRLVTFPTKWYVQVGHMTGQIVRTGWLHDWPGSKGQVGHMTVQVVRVRLVKLPTKW